MRDFHGLTERWRQRALEYKRDGAESWRMWERAADELADVLRGYENALLSPNEAAAETGLAAATIRKRLSQGKLPNEGTPYRPKVRRRALREAVAKQVATRLQVVR